MGRIIVESRLGCPTVHHRGVKHQVAGTIKTFPVRKLPTKTAAKPLSKDTIDYVKQLWWQRYNNECTFLPRKPMMNKE
jgi:hypothetical protein